MIAAIRLKGQIKVRTDTKITMELLGLKRKLSLVVIDEKPQLVGMLKKSKDFITWGEVSPELQQTLKGKRTAQLKPPKGGFSSLKEVYPKGDLGYRGEAINDLIKRMM